MKTIVYIILFLLVCSTAFAGWEGKLTDIKKNDDGTGLVATVVVTDGVYTEILERPMFRPSQVSEVTGLTKNLIAEVKARKSAKDAVNTLYPEAQKEINKPVPEAVA